MKDLTSLNNGGGATPPGRYSKVLGGIVWKKLLSYYGSKALRSNIRHSKPEQYSYVRRRPVILNCQRQDNTLNIGGINHVILKCLRQDNTLNIGGSYHVILNLIQALKKNPPTLTLPPSLRFGNRVAQLVPRWLPLFLNGGREKLAGRLYQADRKTYCRISKPDLQVTKRIDTTPVTNYNSNMMNYKSETLRKNRTFFTKSKILEKVVKRVQDDKKKLTPLTILTSLYSL